MSNDEKYREAIQKIITDPNPVKVLEDLKKECPADAGLILLSDSLLVVSHWGALNAMCGFASAAAAIPGIRKATVKKIQTAALMAAFEFLTVTTAKHREMGPSLEEQVQHAIMELEGDEEEEPKPETVQ